jgi:hypothetical protein
MYLSTPRSPETMNQTRYRVSLEPAASRAAADPEIRNCVQSLLATHYVEGMGVERRRHRRFPFPHLIHLVPLAADGRTPQGAAIVAVAKQLSEGGIGFFHPHPLPYRMVLVVMETADGRRYGLVADLTWCRFTPQGWYESGGRFLRTIPVAGLPPVAPAELEYQI